MTHYQAPTPPAPTKKKSHKLRWFLLILLALIGIVVVMNSVKGSTTSAAPTAAAPAVADAPAVSGVGTAVRDGKFEFTVQAVAPGVSTVGSEYLNAKAQGEFVLVTIKVTNTSDEPQTFFGSSTKALDNAGRTMAPDSSAAIYLPDSNSFITPINPGNSVVGTLVFDVPVGSTLASIELHDSMFSGGVTVQF